VAHEVDRVDRDGVDHAEHVVDDMGHGIGARVVGSRTRPLAVRLELHELDGHRILGLLGATTALDQHESAGLRVAWLKGHAKR
jgi:hypothetical protein